MKVPSLGKDGVLRESMLLAGLKTFLSFSETVKQCFRCECNDINVHTSIDVHDTFSRVFMPP